MRRKFSLVLIRIKYWATRPLRRLCLIWIFPQLVACIAWLHTPSSLARKPFITTFHPNFVHKLPIPGLRFFFFSFRQRSRHRCLFYTTAFYVFLSNPEFKSCQLDILRSSSRTKIAYFFTQYHGYRSPDVGNPTGLETERPCTRTFKHVARKKISLLRRNISKYKSEVLFFKSSFILA